MQFIDLDSLSPNDFEYAIASLLCRCGWSEAIVTRVGQNFQHGDGGVDIVAERRGKKFAIEVKQRTKGANVDIRALNQIETGSKLYGIRNKILITNSYFTSEVKVRALKLGIELIDRDGLKNLWEYESSEIGREIKPRAYQSSIITECISQIENGRTKLLIEMATGLGKTYTSAMIVRALLETGYIKTVLFVAHQVEIITQSVVAFKNVVGIGSYSFSACFDGVMPEETDFVFATFDTLYSKSAGIREDRFDLVIVDEAHHTPARTYGKVVNHFQPRILIGLTATPFRSDGLEVTDFFGGQDGHIGRYDLAWALRHRKLAFPKYKVITNDVSEEKLELIRQGLSTSDIDKTIFLHQKEEGIIDKIAECIRENAISRPKCIIFCRSIEYMTYLLGFFELGEAISVHSRQKDYERRENIRKFRETSLKFILVVDLFNEGIDIPEANILVFLRSTSSKTIWLQQLGRGLRKTKTKDTVWVLDFAGTIDRLEEISAFKKRVENIPLEPESLVPDIDVEPTIKESNLVHDSWLEVEFDESAAQVLRLVESYEYRLTTRARAIEALIAKSKSCDGLSYETVHEGLVDISRDQISTIFGSYYDLLGSIGQTNLMQEVKLQVTEQVRKHRQESGQVLTSNFYRLASSDESLDFAPLRIFEECIAELDKELTSQSISSNESIGTQPNDCPGDDLGMKSKSGADDLLDHEEILARYLTQVQSIDDYKNLSKAQRDEIVQAFGSPFKFFQRLGIR